MRRTFRLIPFLAVSLTSVIADSGSSSTRWTSDLSAWRLQREADLKAPDGWLTLVGLDWLSTGNNSIGSAADNKIRLNPPAAPHIGILQLGSGQVHLLAPSGGFPPSLLVNGQHAHETEVSDANDKPTILTEESLTLNVIRRGDRYALRVKDANSPTRLGFHGLHWYPSDPRYRIQARWIPWNPPHQEKIPTVIGTTVSLPAPGIAEFTLNGQTLRVEPVLESPNEKELFFILRDVSSRTTSYGAGRFLYTEFPDQGLDKPGHLILDFNRLQNPPCAYTPFATCPLPPEQNRLAISLPVGEKRYSH
jgi:uncharacterized protein (DUF1684 family)